MENGELNELLKMWNHVFDAVMKMDDRLTEILEDDDEDDFDDEEEGVPA